MRGTTALLLFAVSLRLTKCRFSMHLTCVEQVQGVVKHISLVHFSVTAEDDESIADEQTGVADSGTWAF